MAEPAFPFDADECNVGTSGDEEQYSSEVLESVDLESMRTISEGELKVVGEANTQEERPSDQGTSSKCVILELEEFLAHRMIKREYLIAPVLPTQGLAMLYAPRGLGKTFVSLALGYAVASGSDIFRWKVEKPKRVLYLDGEMPGSDMQQRIAAIESGSVKHAEPGFFKIFNPDLQPRGVRRLNLAYPESQAILDPFLANVDLLIIDNLATLARKGKENESESWLPVQNWLLEKRSMGVSVLCVHHSNKNGDQRGTSSREDVMDTVIKLQRPADYNMSQGARVEVHLTKSRGIAGKDVEPFEVRLMLEDGKADWATCGVVPGRKEDIRVLLDSGMSIRQIAVELGISSSTVGRIAKEIKEEGSK